VYTRRALCAPNPIAPLCGAAMSRAKPSRTPQVTILVLTLSASFTADFVISEPGKSRVKYFSGVPRSGQSQLESTRINWNEGK
jgi:hypothetical protein